MTIPLTTPVTGTPYPPIGLISGALVALKRVNPTPTSTHLVPFQYNPDTLSRTMTPAYYEASKDRFTGPAKQSLDVTVKLEASRSALQAQSVGVLPYLAALELMIYPDSDDLDKYVQDTKSNKMKAVPPLAPRTLFIWGPGRILPVRLTSITSKETLFSPQLSPIMADVTLKMEMYPFEEADSSDYQLLLTHLKLQEGLRAALVAGAAAKAGLSIASML